MSDQQPADGGFPTQPGPAASPPPPGFPTQPGFPARPGSGEPVPPPGFPPQHGAPPQQPGAAPYGAPTGYQPYAPGLGPSEQKTDGKLIAAGVLCLISGGVTALIGLLFFAITADADTAWIDDLSGGALTFAALFMLALAAVYITAGIGSVRGQNWGRITAIVINAIFLVLVVVGIASDPGAAGGSVIPLAWCGTIVGLAWAGSPKR